jgi:large subunit ribosomal protein L15
VVNLERIVEQFPETHEVTLQDLYTIVSQKRPIKILGRGKIDRTLRITAHAFSKQAMNKIEQAGGKAVALEG